MHSRRHATQGGREQSRQAYGGWGPGGGPRGRGGRGGRRTKRGNVRAAILALLAERPMHGYEMIQELESRTGGLWRPSPGSVYPTLQLLEDEDLITGEESAGKRLFALTDTGRAQAQALETSPWDEITENAGEAATHGRAAVGQLMMAFGQVMQAGSEEQRGRALEVISDARRRLYGILAEDPESTG
jgi:DNA-binding PadR family transcriptional regulator